MIFRAAMMIAIAAAATFAASGKTPAEFNRHFSDSTLRVDLIVGSNAMNPSVMVRSMSKYRKWAGRRVNLASLPLRGNARLTATDLHSGDTIYQSSFSTLFNEWYMTGLAAERAEAFEHSLLMPLPKDSCRLAVTFNDPHARPIASAEWIYSPADILVADRTSKPRFEHRWIHGSERKADSRIDVAIVGEGYRRADRKKFFADAGRVVTSLMEHEAFSDNADRFNFVAVAAESADCGVSVPLQNRWCDTAFGSHFSTFYSDRYLTIPDIFKLNDVLDGIPYEHIIVIANTDQYGGGGIYNDYALSAADHPLFREVVVHEFGHSFGGLADEYFYEGDVMDDTYPLNVEPWEPNVTTLVNFKGKWENLIDGYPESTDGRNAAGPGLVEGAAYSFKGIYRAEPDCRMKTNEAPEFCAACRQAIQRIIDFHTQSQR